MTMRRFTVLIYLTMWVVLSQGSEKKGVVHWADSYMCDDFKALDNMTWWYDFRMSLSYFHEKHICSSTIDNYKKTHVPMVWRYSSKTKINIADEAEYILGFNEPNHKKQANMTPKQAADAWPEVEKHSKGRPLVSPSAAHCGKECLSDEITWFDEFFKLCKGCRIDYLATHTYWCNAGKVMHYLKMLNKKYGRKIWLTEFACSKTLSPKVQLDFMTEILPELEAADYIFRYSWYRARINATSGFITKAASLLKEDSSTLSPLGRFYNNFKGTKDKFSTLEPKTETTTPSSGDTSKVGRVETLLILQSYTTNPTLFWKMLNYIKRNSYKLPESVQTLYNKSSKKELRQRIKKRFKEIVCTAVHKIQDNEIRKLVEKIRKLPRNKSRGGGGQVRVPKC